jgi:hypothetical protein
MNTSRLGRQNNAVWVELSILHLNPYLNHKTFHVVAMCIPSMLVSLPAVLFPMILKQEITCMHTSSHTSIPFLPNIQDHT